MQKSLDPILNMLKSKDVYGDGNKFIKVLKESRYSGNYNDVKIELDDGECLFATRTILAAGSEYFDSLFRFKGNSKPEGNDGQTVVKVSCSKKVMNLVLDCLYGVEVKYETLDVLESLEYLEMLRTMLLEEAFNHLEEYILAKLHQEMFLPLRLHLKVLERSMKLKFDKIVQKLISGFDFKTFMVAVENDTTEGAFAGWMTEVSKETILLLFETGQKYNEFERFKFYVSWIKSVKNQLTDEESDRLSATFDLGKFTVEQLLSDDVVGCGFFALMDIHQTVGERYRALQEAMREAEKRNEALENSTERINQRVCTTCKRVSDALRYR